MIGRQIGSYTVREWIGEGGMGRVYEAWHERLQRRVALKALPTGSSEERKRRFLREARTLSTLNHPEIVTVHDLIVGDAGDFLVMELVEGRSLDAILEGGSLPVERVLNLATRISGALQAAHEEGVIHRDLKPSNVMLSDKGALKIVDFGLAKLVAPSDRKSANATQAGDVLGTYGYMSPEQARGEPIDHRSDVFSFGTLVYEMLAGCQPFPGSNPAVIAHRLIASEPTPLDEVRSDLPEKLTGLVHQCLRKDAEDRPQSFALVLEALLALDPVVSRRAPAGDAASTPPTSRERRIRVFWLWLGVATVLVLAVLILVQRTPDEGSPLSIEATLPTSPDALYREGMGLLARHDRRGNLDLAMERFRSATELNPQYGAALAGLAEAELETFVNENRDEVWLQRAFQTATAAVEVDAHLAAARTVLGRVLTRQGDYERAANELAKAAMLDSNSTDVHRAIGNLAHAQDELGQAEQHFSRAVELDPEEWRNYSDLVELLFAMGRFSEAHSAVLRWIEVTPDNVFAFQSLGAIQALDGELAEASSSLQRALEIRPEANVYSNLGTLLFMQGLYEQSAEAFRNAVERKPNQRLFWFNLGDALRQVQGSEKPAQEAFARAIQLTRKALENNPTDVLLLSDLAECQAKLGDLEGALATLALLEQQDGVTRPLAWFSAMKAYEIAGEREGALRNLRRALEQGYPRDEIEADPDLLELRQDVRYHQLVARFD